MTECYVVVRIYANFAALAHALTTVVRGPKDALSYFAARFNLADPLCDFIDTGKKLGTTAKIANTFRLFMDQPQCKHIVFGACSDAQHLAMLRPYQDCKSRLTLLTGRNSLHHGYESFSVGKTGFNSTFFQRFVAVQPPTHSTDNPRPEPEPQVEQNPSQDIPDLITFDD